MGDHLFTYGTLEAPALMRRLLGRLPERIAATLPAFRCRRLKGADYPAVIANPRESVAGTLYLDLKRSELARLDRYEGEEYLRGEVVVISSEGREWLSHCYLLKPALRGRLSRQRWQRCGPASGQ